MSRQWRFPVELKRQVVEELLSGITSPAQLCRRHNISSGLLYYWKKEYSRGKFGNEPTHEATEGQVHAIVLEFPRYAEGEIFGPTEAGGGPALGVHSTMRWSPSAVLAVVER